MLIHVSDKELRKEDYKQFKKLRKEGHSLYCAINMVLACDKCRCKEKIL